MKDNAKLPTKLLLVLLVAIVASLAAPGRDDHGRFSAVSNS